MSFINFMCFPDEILCNINYAILFISDAVCKLFCLFARRLAFCGQAEKCFH